LIATFLLEFEQTQDVVVPSAKVTLPVPVQTLTSVSVAPVVVVVETVGVQDVATENDCPVLAPFVLLVCVPSVVTMVLL
jgi:hypothetical protein